MKTYFRSELCSPPDREKLVIHLFYDNEQVAEINQEIGSLQIEIYSRQSGKPWNFSFSEFMDALNKAKNRLLPSLSPTATAESPLHEHQAPDSANEDEKDGETNNPQ